MFPATRVSTQPNLSPRQQWAWVVGLSLALLVVVNVPYLWAYTVSDAHFLGVLMNPQDGHSYLAKMRLGWEGAWLFALPYTPEPGPGVFLYTYYLGLGQLARVLGWPLALVYHLTRTLTGGVFLLSAYAFISQFFMSGRSRLLAWLIFTLGSGLGWIAAFAGWLTVDLWVAELIPFLTVFTNGHFALAAALQLWLVQWALLPGPLTGQRQVWTGLATVGLVVVQPQTWLAVMVLVVAVVGWRLLQTRQVTWAATWPFWVIGGSGVPLLAYTSYVFLTHPVLAGWAAQNITLSPPLWEAIVAGGVPLALAFTGLLFVPRRQTGHDAVIVLWFVVGAAATYLPFFAQRRLVMGLWMPLSILAAYGWREIVVPHFAPRWRNFVLAGLAVATVMSNGLVYLATLAAVATRNEKVFLTLDEDRAVQWLATHAAQQLVVASPEVGLVLPSLTGARVFYGHPMETVNAPAAEAAVAAFFAIGQPLTPAPAFVFYGPREQQLGTPAWAGWQRCATFGTVVIYGRACAGQP